MARLAHFDIRSCDTLIHCPLIVEDERKDGRDGDVDILGDDFPHARCEIKCASELEIAVADRKFQG